MAERPDRAVGIYLTRGDTKLLADLAARMGCGKSELMRWALRWYAVAGPEGAVPADVQERCRRGMEGLEIGPARYRVASEVDGVEPDVTT